MVSLTKGDPVVSPTTQPAQAVSSTQPTCDVYVTPFTALGTDNSLDWAGKAVAQNLLTDLARSGKFHPLASDKPIGTAADAKDAAKAVGAKYLITGTYQSLELQVRFNGQIIDTATGNVLGGIVATGSPRDLFALEDSLSAQALTQLSQLPNIPAVAAAPVNKPAGPVPPALQPQVVLQVIAPPAVGQPGTASSYAGSALEDYVNSNRTPSTDYSQQVQDAQDRQNDSWPYVYYSPSYGYGGIGPYLGSYGYGYGYGIGFIYGGAGGGYRYGDHHAHGVQH